MSATLKFNKEDVWRDFKKTGSQELKNILIEEYLPLVRHIAERMSEKLPPYVEVDDIASLGIFGLIDAIERFDINRGIKFEAYCTRRVKGSIIDELRKNEWIPRFAREKVNRLEDAYSKLENKFGRSPTDKELSKELTIGLKKLRKLRVEASSINMLRESITYVKNDNDRLLADSELVEDYKIHNSSLEDIKSDLLEYITNATTQVERYILMLYYFDDLTLK